MSISVLNRVREKGHVPTPTLVRRVTLTLGVARRRLTPERRRRWCVHLGSLGKNTVVFGVKSVSLGGHIMLTPVTKIYGSTFHLAMGRFNTNLMYTRVIDSGKVIAGGRGAVGVLCVSRERGPLDLRVFKNRGRALMRTTGFMSGGAGTSVVSVGVKYPIPGVAGYSTNTG